MLCTRTFSGAFPGMKALDSRCGGVHFLRLCSVGLFALLSMRVDPRPQRMLVMCFSRRAGVPRGFDRHRVVPGQPLHRRQCPPAVDRADTLRREDHQLGGSSSMSPDEYVR
jgi:hypothetical protein